MKRLYFFSLLMMICCVIAKSQSVVVDGITYYVNPGDGTSEVKSGKDAKGDVVIPNEVTYLGKSYRVYQIMYKAFYDNKEITSVKLPNTVEDIRAYAFLGCSRLSSVTGGADEFEFIGDCVFDGTPWVDKLPKEGCLTYWKNWIIGTTNAEVDECRVKDGTLGLCQAITAKTVYLPKSFRYYVRDHFNVEKIVVDKDNPYIYSDEYGAIYERDAEEYYSGTRVYGVGRGLALSAVPRNNSAEEFKVPEGVKFLRSFACDYANFEKIIVPEGCVAVLQYNFYKLKRCKRIELPSTIEFIDMYTPMGDDDLEIVLKAKEVPDTEGNMFTFTGCSHVTLYVPAESLDKYLADAAYQGKFKAIKAIPDDKIVGDVDGDGTVNSADVVAVYNYITNGADSGIELSSADVNGDNVVNSGDVVEVYNLIINGTAQSK